MLHAHGPEPRTPRRGSGRVRHSAEDWPRVHCARRGFARPSGLTARSPATLLRLAGTARALRTAAPRRRHPDAHLARSPRRRIEVTLVAPPDVTAHHRA